MLLSDMSLVSDNAYKACANVLIEILSSSPEVAVSDKRFVLICLKLVYYI